MYVCVYDMYVHASMFAHMHVPYLYQIQIQTLLNDPATDWNEFEQTKVSYIVTSNHSIKTLVCQLFHQIWGDWCSMRSMRSMCGGFVCICMHACMHGMLVCMYVCMYVCMCIYVCMYVCVYVWYVCMYCMYMCTYACTIVCIYDMYVRIWNASSVAKPTMSTCTCVCMYLWCVCMFTFMIAMYDMIWYDMIWYDMIWYDMIWYDM